MVVLDFTIVNVALPQRACPAGYQLAGEQERSRTLGFYTAVASAGFASGAVLGGLLAEATWRLVFLVNVPAGLGLLAASMRLLPADPPRRAERLDLPGAVSVTAGVALLVLAAARADDTLRAIQPALLAVAAIVLLGAFAASERGLRHRPSTLACPRLAASSGPICA